MGAERSQWLFPPNVRGKLIGWRDSGVGESSNGLENKDPADIIGSVGSDVLAGLVGLPVPAVANTFLQRNAGNTAYQALGAADVRNVLDVPPYVASLAALQGIDTAKDTVAILTDPLREGRFYWNASDLSAIIARVSVTSTSVDAGTDTITKIAHTLWTGQAVIATTAVNGLSTNTIYYVNRINADTFKLCATFADAHAGTAVDLTGTTNFTVKRLQDPLQGVYVIPTGLALDGSQGAFIRRINGVEVFPYWFGYEGGNVAATNDAPALQAAINFAADAFSGSGGMQVQCGAGIAFLGQLISLPNRVAVRGLNGRGTRFKPHSTFTANQMFWNINTGVFGEAATTSTFGSRLQDLWIDTRGYNMTEVVLAEAWQETCGMERVLIEFDGTTQYGVRLQSGFGGASYTTIKDCEIFSSSTNVASAGIRVEQISVVGNFMLRVDGCSITGDVTNPIVTGISLANDSCLVTCFHVEYCVTALSANGAGSISVDTLTGSSNAVTNLVAIGSGFTGKVSLRNIMPLGATGDAFQNNVTGEDIPCSEGVLAEYVYPKSGFLARIAADLINQTGNSGSPILICETEVFDRRGEYNPATGIFTAARTGKYNFSTLVKAGPSAAGTTNCIVTLITSNRNYELFRGDWEGFRDSSSNVGLALGMTSVDMDAGDTARITVTVTGLAGNTIGFLAGSYFAGSWIER